MIAAERDQVRADQAVGGEAADEERGEQEPERARARGPAQCTEGGGDHAGARRGRRRRRGGIAAVRHQSDLRGPVRHQPPGQRHQGRRGRGHGRDHAGPVAGGSQRGQGRQEHQRAGRGAGGQQAHHQSAMGAEPAIHDRGAQHDGDRARADAREHAPAQQQVPGFGHIGAGRAGHGHQAQRANEHPAQAEVFHRGGGEGTDQAIEEDPQRGGE